MSKFINPDYKGLYKIYKKLPTILSIVIAILMFVWSIVDVSVFQDVETSGSYWLDDYTKTTYYGVMHIKSAFAAVMLWWVIGIFIVAINHFFCSLAMSPIVVKTDAVLEIESKLISNSNNEKEDVKPVIDAENKNDNQSILE